MVPKYLIIHHAAHGTKEVNGNTSAKNIDHWHKDRGWDGIGYHYVVRLDGSVEKGRQDDERGAHCPGYNNRSLGICFAGHGNYHYWTPAQKGTGLALVKRLMEEFNIPIQNVLGHNEAGRPTDCPGKLTDMKQFRTILRADLGNPPMEHSSPIRNHLGIFQHICNIFDDPEWNNLPKETQRVVKELRYAEPFADLTREDLQ